MQKEYLVLCIPEEFFIGVDNASGGYPYLTPNFKSAMVWSSVEDALGYQKKFTHNYKGEVKTTFHMRANEWQVRKVYLTI